MSRSPALRRTALRRLGVPEAPAAGRWALVAVVDAIGTGMFLPISVLYFTVVVGLSAGAVGAGLGIAGLVGSVATPLSGTLIDRFGARKVVVCCWAAGAVAYVGYLGVRDWGGLVAVASVAHVADRMVNPARKVFLTSIADAEDRVSLMAFQRAVLNVGFGLGGLITAAVLAIGSDTGYHAVLVANAVSYAGAIALVLTVPVIRPLRPDRPPEEGRPRAGYRQVLADRRYVSLAVLNILVLVYSTAFTIGMPLWVYEYTSAPAGLVGLLFTFNTVLVVLLQIRAAKSCTSLAQAPRVYRVAAALFVLAALGYWAAHRSGGATAVAIGLLVLAVLAHTLTELLGAVGEWTVSMTLAPERLRGRYLSLFGLSLSAQEAIGPALVTALIAADADLAWFALAALLALGCLLSAWLVRTAVGPDAPDDPAEAPTDAKSAAPSTS
ncbi:MFS transporter [Streptomyces sp. NBC_00078]|uniref:MFS transporter n=1 Tax=unclassified Streptomyces TaxID=2593676 RepID=UPI002257FEA7|nr:MFS transporter [Streptomyces sp. NBC_00078]MCX5418123.1 MFS transporter [Streptomyces sp. NBC_00078]MCX5426071.1 MFS transporter [Streptomyces sp. NBC_00078]MCX5426160.1 MFS transporter [Streptomyces sp. NBC_00078]